MIGDYNSRLYEPAHEAFLKVREDSFQYAREKAKWVAGVQRAWDNVQIADGITTPGPSILSGRPLPLQANVALAGLKPEDVRVEAVVGRVGVNGTLEETTVLTLPAVGERNGQQIFAREFVPHQTGRLGYALRISPNHCEDPLTRPCFARLKWAQR